MKRAKKRASALLVGCRCVVKRHRHVTRRALMAIGSGMVCAAAVNDMLATVVLDIRAGGVGGENAADARMSMHELRTCGSNLHLLVLKWA